MRHLLREGGRPCDACGKDKRFSTLALIERHRTIKDDRGAWLHEQIWYCADDVECYLKAQCISKVPTEGFELPAEPLKPSRKHSR
jgi:hypothetical protein